MVKTPGSRKFIAFKKYREIAPSSLLKDRFLVAAEQLENPSELKEGSSHLMQQKFMGSAKHDATAALHNSAVSLPLA